MEDIQFWIISRRYIALSADVQEKLDIQTDSAAALAAATAALGRALDALWRRPGDQILQVALDLGLMRANALASALLFDPAMKPQAVRAKAAALAWQIGCDEPGAVLNDHWLEALRCLFGDIEG